MPGDSSSRQELGQFLRSRRGRVSPADVGFPVGSRRRTKGLRREEVAVLAGLSPTWYTYLEQGRDIRPSPEVLNSLARVLRLTEDERRYMHTLAYGVVIGPQPLDMDIPATRALREIVALTDKSPYPVYAGNAVGDVICWNQAATEWYDDWGRLAPEERNMLRWLLTSPKARERVVDWELETRELIARWRAQMVRSHSDDELQQYVEEFSSLSPEFAQWWDDHDVMEHRTRVRRLRHPKLGIRAMHVVLLQAPEFPLFGAVFHIPAQPEGG
ncbi:MAG TPA: helix-turn-helix transcriptional regulator [Streptosporangiaceae bacterium]|nr:helix-turn-helix transcriptional regulator [Streptosporangiaceae bacterium]